MEKKYLFSKLHKVESTYIERIKYDIQNCTRLSQEQVEAMLYLTEVEKNELLLLFNDVIGQLQQFLRDI